MREIIGEYIENILKDAGCTAECKYKGKQGLWSNFSIWEIDEVNYEILVNYTMFMSTEEWMNKYSKEWWRYSDGSNLGEINTTVRIRDKMLNGWHNDSVLNGERFTSILDYFLSFGASTETNVAALSTDVAKANDISIAELFSMYGE